MSDPLLLKLCLRDCCECDLLKFVDINVFHSRRVTAVINPNVFQNILLGMSVFCKVISLLIIISRIRLSFIKPNSEYHI